MGDTQEPHISPKTFYGSNNTNQNTKSETRPKRKSNAPECGSPSKEKKLKNTRYKPVSPEYSSIVPAIPESQLTCSQESQPMEKRCREVSKKQEKRSRKNTSAAKQPAQSKQVEGSNEDKDPYKFTDTESVYSNVDDKGQKQPAPKKTNKQAGKKSSQVSTQAFTPAFSPYKSQDDFRSPIALSGMKSNKKNARKERGSQKDKKKESKNAKKGKGKKGKQDNPSQDDDSMSDVEIMRDASVSKSSIKQKHPLYLSDDEGVHIDEDVYEFSDGFTNKLNKKKEELEKFLDTSGRKSTTSANMTKSGKSKTGKSWKKQNTASSDESKPVAIDSDLRKFPTRSGPIPTPDMVDDDKRRMKKKKPIASSSEDKMPFKWDLGDDDDKEEKEDVEEKVPEKKSKKSSNKSKIIDVDDKDQSGTEGFDVAIHEDVDSDVEVVVNRADSKQQNKIKSRKSKNNTTDDSMKNTPAPVVIDSDTDDVPGHEEISDEDDWNQERNTKWKSSEDHKNDTKQRKESNSVSKGRYDEAVIDREIDLYLDSQMKTALSGKGEQSDADDDDLGDSQEESRQTRKSKAQKQSSKRKSLKTPKESKTSRKEEKCSDSDASADVENENETEGNSWNRKSKPRKSLSKITSKEKNADVLDMDEDALIEDKLKHYSRMMLLEVNKQDKGYPEDEPHQDSDDVNDQQQQKGRGKSGIDQDKKKPPQRRHSTKEDLDISDDADEAVQEKHQNSRRNSKERGKSADNRKKETKKQQDRYRKEDSDMSDNADEEAEQEKHQNSRRDSKERGKPADNRKKETKKQQDRYRKEDSDAVDEEDEESLHEKPKPQKRRSLADIDMEIKKSKSGKPKEKSTKMPGKSKQHQEKSKKSDKQKKNNSRMYGSQIEEPESDEAVNDNADDRDFDTETIASVESFHSLCKVRF